MNDTIMKPRSVPSVLLVGLFAGPFFLMLWIGRWAWALTYFGAGFAISVALSALRISGFLQAESLILGLPASTILSILMLHLLGVVHALTIRRNSTGRPWYRYFIAIPVLLVALLPIRTFLLQPFSIPSSSQYPALIPGDYILLSKWDYGYSQYSFGPDLVHFAGRIWRGAPERGDLTVFKLPANTQIDYVKRVVGLPGDRIRMKGGVLIINDIPVPRVQVTVSKEYDKEGKGTYWRETLPNGRSYVVLELNDFSEADNTDEYIVPEDCYFVLGDNRDNSQDSRYLNQVGYVPLENFIGRVWWVFYNSSGYPVSNRPH